MIRCRNAACFGVCSAYLRYFALLCFTLLFFALLELEAPRAWTDMQGSRLNNANDPRLYPNILPPSSSECTLVVSAGKDAWVQESELTSSLFMSCTYRAPMRM